MKQKKKIVHVFLIVPIFIVCLVVGGVVAYAAMTVREEKVNLFQVGNLQTKVEEVFTEPIMIYQINQLIKK